MKSLALSCYLQEIKYWKKENVECIIDSYLHRKCKQPVKELKGAWFFRDAMYCIRKRMESDFFVSSWSGVILGR